MNEQYYTWDDPVPYKGLFIHPVTMKDHMLFQQVVICLLLNKNQQVNEDMNLTIKILSMTYLDYLYYLLTEGTPEFWNMLLHLMTLILKDQNFTFVARENGDIYFIIDGIDYEFNAQDFDNIKIIILEQNDIPIEDEILNPELEEDLKRAKELKRKLNNMTSADLEELLAIITMYIGLQKKEIKEMTIRFFNKIIERMGLFEDYKIYKTAESSGNVEFKEPIRHWLSHITKEGYYDDVKVNQNDITDKFKDVVKI